MRNASMKSSAILIVLTLAALIALTSQKAAADMLYDYTGTAKISFSDLGEMPGFEYPAGYEHILIGTFLEGWTVSFRIGETEYHYWSGYDDRGGGVFLDGDVDWDSWIEAVSYTVLQNDADQLTIECKTKTSNDLLEITHLLQMDKAESRVFLNARVKNLTAGTVSDVRFKRFCDLDIDTGGELGWADFNGLFELTANGVRNYTTEPIEGREAHGMTMYGIPTPDWFGADDWDDWYQRDNPPDFTEAEYPVEGDYTATLSWDLGNLAPSASSATVTTLYSMDIGETNKPNGIATDENGVPVVVFDPSGDVYVTGNLFPPGGEVNIYVVADRGWGGGEVVVDALGIGVTSVVADGEGNIGPLKIWSAPLENGKYDVVFDANRNGTYEYINDAIIGEGTTGFAVGKPFTAEKQQGGVTQESYRLVSVPLLRVPGNTLGEAIDSGVPDAMTYGADGDIRIILWNAVGLQYEELLGEPPAFTPMTVGSTDLAGKAFWRIVRSDYDFSYDGDDPPAGQFEILLQPGWNVFGFPFNDLDVIDVDQLLVSSASTEPVLLVDAANTITSHSVWEFEDRSVPADGKVDDNEADNSDYDAAQFIAKGYGYWLYVKAAEPVFLLVPHGGVSPGAATPAVSRSPMSVASAATEPLPPSPPVMALTENGSGGGSATAASSGCFIATAAYGSLLHPHVKVLRQFRDHYLLNSETGQRFVQLYYTYSPPLADFIAGNQILRGTVQLALLPLVGMGYLFLNFGPFVALILMFMGLAMGACATVAGVRIWCRQS